jgi:hypothetical protein
MPLTSPIIVLNKSLRIGEDNNGTGNKKKEEEEIAINKKWGLYQSPNKKGESVNPPHQVYTVFSCVKKLNQSLKNVYRPG